MTAAPDFEERSKPAPPRKVKKMNFFKKFVELQLQMLQQNNHLTASHPYASGPINWPFTLQGISFWTDNDELKQIYLVGNPASWWLSVLCVSVYVGIMAADTVARRRGFYPISNSIRTRMINTVGFFVLAWSFHYLPFFLMNRQLFIHHYLPAHVCACAVMGSVFNFIATETVNGPLSRPGPSLLDDRLRLKGTLRRTTFNEIPRPVKAVAGAIVGVVIVVFWHLAPLTYGDVGLNPDEVQARKWLQWSLHFAK